VGSQELLVGQRIQPLSNSGTWRRYLGDYAITNLEDDRKMYKRISLIEDHGFLLIELTPAGNPKVKSRIPLKPVSENEALLLGTLNDAGDTLGVVQENGEERVLFSGYLLKKIVR
jgi:hypothetical protein